MAVVLLKGVAVAISSCCTSDGRSSGSRPAPSGVMEWSGAIAKQHTFQVAAEGIAVRSGPHEQADRTGEILHRGEIFIAEQVIEGQGKDQRIYLKLPEDRGWVFDDGKIYPEDPSVRPWNPKNCAVVEAKPLLGAAVPAREDSGVVPASTPPQPLPPKSPVSSPGRVRAATTPTHRVCSPAQVLIGDVASPQRAVSMPKFVAAGTPPRATSVPGHLGLVASSVQVHVASLTASPGTPVRSSPSSRTRAPAASPQATWSMLRSYRLCEVGEEDCYSTGLFLDKAAIASVSAAVEDLNQGKMKCDDVACAVLSAKRKEWYVLYQANQKEAAEVLFTRVSKQTPPEGAALQCQVVGRAADACPSPPVSFAAKWHQRPSIGSWLLLPVAPLRRGSATPLDTPPAPSVSMKLTAIPGGVGSSVSTRVSAPAVVAPQRSRTPAKPQAANPAAQPSSARGPTATSPRGTAPMSRSTSSQLTQPTSANPGPTATSPRGAAPVSRSTSSQLTQPTSTNPGSKPCNSTTPGCKASSAELEERAVAEKKKELKLLAEKNARRVARMKVEGKEEKTVAADENTLRNTSSVVPPLALRRSGDAPRASQPLSARRSPDEAPPLLVKNESSTTTNTTDFPESPPTMPGTPVMGHCKSERATGASTSSSAVPVRQVSYPGPRLAPGMRPAVASAQSPVVGSRVKSTTWNAVNSFALCKEGEEAAFAGKGTFLDRAVIASVNAAVQELNRGSVRLRGETCAVFSASRREWYVLHSPGRREAALKQFGVDVAPPARVAVATPQQATRVLRGHATPQQASRPGTPAQPVPVRSAGGSTQTSFAVKQPVIKRVAAALATASTPAPSASPPRHAAAPAPPLKVGSPSPMHRALAAVPGAVLSAAPHVVPLRTSPRQKSNAAGDGAISATPSQLSHPQTAARV